MSGRKSRPPAPRQNPPRDFSAPPSFSSHLLKLAGWAALAWAAFVVLRYARLYPLRADAFLMLVPARLPAVSTILFYGWNLFLFAGIAAGSLALGQWGLGFFKIRWAGSLEKGIFSVAAGYGFLSLLVLAAAALHVLTTAAMAGLWAAGVLFFLSLLRKDENRAFLSGLLREASGFLFGAQNPLLFRVFLWAYLGISLMMALVPELFYDALVYHLGAPNLYLQEKGLVRIAGATSKFPFLWQMLYALGLSLSDEILPKLLHASSGLLIVLASGSLGARLALPGTGMLAALIFLSAPMVQMNLWTSGVDVGSCLFAFLAVYSLCAWAQEKSRETPQEPSPAWPWILAAALFSGLAYGSKYQGGILAAVVFLTGLLLHLWQGPRDARTLARYLFGFGIVSFAAVLPWLLKNFWDTGNPLYPFLSPLFTRLGTQTYFMDPEQWKMFIGENRRYLTYAWAEHWKLPWILTFSDNQQSSLSFPGPFFLAFLPLGLFALREAGQRWLRVLAVFLAIFFAFAFQSTHLTRYHLQAYPALAFFMALGISGFCLNKDRITKTVFMVLLALGLLSNLQTGLFIIGNSYRPWDVLAGAESREAYKNYTHSGLNPYPANAIYRWMDKNLPAESRTLLIGDSKPYDLKRRHLYSDVHGKNPLMPWAEASQTPEDLHRRFQEAGITHLLINFTEAHRTYGYKMIKWEPVRLQNFHVFWNRHVREVRREPIPEKFFKSESALLLYEILPEEAAKSKPVPEPDPLVVLDQMNRR